jgi:hypothetical protein
VGHDETAASHELGRRYTVNEAAMQLGLSVDAVRKRAERGRLKKEKDADGTVYILLDPDQPTSEDETGLRAMGARTATSQNALVNSLREQIEYLRRELDIRNEELRRKDHLLEAALERIPELQDTKRVPSANVVPSDGATEPRGSSGTPTEGIAEGGVPLQEPAQRRSWLVRFFFGP